jgi:hypothetical protein
VPQPDILTEHLRRSMTPMESTHIRSTSTSSRGGRKTCKSWRHKSGHLYRPPSGPVPSQIHWLAEICRLSSALNFDLQASRHCQSGPLSAADVYKKDRVRTHSIRVQFLHTTVPGRYMIETPYNGPVVMYWARQANVVLMSSSSPSTINVLPSDHQ